MASSAVVTEAAKARPRPRVSTILFLSSFLVAGAFLLLGHAIGALDNSIDAQIVYASMGLPAAMVLLSVMFRVLGD